MGVRGSFKGFTPHSIPEVAAGYYWDPAEASGSDLATFLLREGNKKTAYDMVTPSLGTAPAIGVLNNEAVITYTNQAVADDSARTALTVQRGWTGATMVWGWFTAASAPNTFFAHSRAVTNLLIQTAAGDWRIGAHDGTDAIEYRFPLPPGGYAAGPVYVEVMFVPSAASTNRLQLAYNRVAQTPTVTVAMDVTLRDTAEYLNFASTVSDSNTNNIAATFSVGVWGITNGIPSAKDRDRLFNHRRLAPA